MTSPVPLSPSGRRYNRTHVLDVLEHRAPDPAEHTWKTRDFHCRELGPDIYLLTYTLEQGERVSRRSMIWRRSGEGWVIVFHQGTLVAPLQCHIPEPAGSGPRHPLGSKLNDLRNKSEIKLQ